MKQEEALKVREKLLREFPNPEEILRGSLLQRTVRHRRGCQTCRHTKGHPVWVLTVSYKGGRTRQLSVPREQKEQVRRWLRNYREIKARLEALCEVNQKLLRPER